MSYNKDLNNNNNSAKLLVINNLVKHFDISGGFLDRLNFNNFKLNLTKTIVHAVNDVSFSVQKGETLSVVGESGCGKSTLARLITCLYPPNSGEIYFDNIRIDNLSFNKILPIRKRMQMIFQDPYASLNPRMKVIDILKEPVEFHFPKLSKKEVIERVFFVMEQVGVRKGWANQYPHEFSGGQRQRISIARALIVDPEFVIADEPISALDVSIQAQILNLLIDAQEERSLTYLFITHDLSVVEHISSRVAVMYLGNLCELSPTKELFENPKHPYTKTLLSAIPSLGLANKDSANKNNDKHKYSKKTDKKFNIKVLGEIPTPIELPSGCVFHTRCPYLNERCRQEIPKLRQISFNARDITQNIFVACHAIEENKL